MRYFFILGSNPSLSAAEILASAHHDPFAVVEIHKQAMVFEGREDVDTREFISRLGGTVKIGKLQEGEFAIDEKTVIRLMSEVLMGRSSEGKVNFGFSVYALEGDKPSRKAAAVAGKLKRAGMEVKRILKEAGIASRWVRPKTGSAITSVAVDKNGLTKDGIEFIILVKGDRMLFGITDAVQLFEEYSEVDYGRPSRDTLQGMLPPKLARMMLNIANIQPGEKVWDPFCGSGTVVTEALRLGVMNVSGSDVNPKAVNGTKENVAWLKERKLSPQAARVNIFQADARETPAEIGPGSLDAIVTEPYLGPPRTGREPKKELEKRIRELTKLYRDALVAMKPSLKPNGAIVMALPLYIVGLERLGIDVIDLTDTGFRTDHIIPPMLAKRMGIQETKNRGLPYGRNDQKVWREIVRFRVA
ncbi:MAG: 50S ribosomal protein L11 methyltransferase [Patescibacteria group bacterium]|nr:50S ribosomal protein L11 methyltransferase [Patescibacteria group bacterium]